MAKYVLLSFDKDEDADTFVEDCQAYPESKILTPCQENDVHGVVEAVFKKPTKFCECTPTQRRGKVGVTGAKFGWYVCGNCHKPAKGGGQTIPNLLEMDLPPWKRQIHLQVRCDFKGWIEPNWTPPQLVKKDTRR
jgi:hypothetical protein